MKQNPLKNLEALDKECTESGLGTYTFTKDEFLCSASYQVSWLNKNDCKSKCATGMNNFRSVDYFLTPITRERQF